MTTSTMQPQAADTRSARRAMIDSQLRTSGVNEEYVLARMISVERERYLPAEKAALAYIDRSVALPGGGHLAAPLFYGKVLTEADPSSDDRVLVMTNGSDYLADLVRPLVARVDTMTVDRAKDASFGPDDSYSLILIDGAIEQLPAKFADALEGNGRIVSGLVLRQVTRLASGRKIAGTLALQPVEDLGIPVLNAFDKPKSWTF